MLTSAMFFFFKVRCCTATSYKLRASVAQHLHKNKINKLPYITYADDLFLILKIKIVLTVLLN